VTTPKRAPAAPTTDCWALGAAWLHDASATLGRAAGDVDTGDVDRALARIDAAVATAESARAELRKQRSRHTVAGVMAEVIREHLQEDERQ
jgi:hypothetical protein